MDEIKKYRLDQKKVKVSCPCCGKLMRGWTRDRGWDKYWIAHIVPNKKVACWATEEQMVRVKEEWERKYECVENRDPGSDQN